MTQLLLKSFKENKNEFEEGQFLRIHNDELFDLLHEFSFSSSKEKMYSRKMFVLGFY